MGGSLLVFGREDGISCGEISRVCRKKAEEEEEEEEEEAQHAFTGSREEPIPTSEHFFWHPSSVMSDCCSRQQRF
ncbi:hypothetical protein SLEP1_g31896 [Rubroshorea leprosula]|uniref:Uncharacterized protein n=1 Tax=Rubroshorea leprosula TaxID=152421 RepID=A0AAV5KBP1_9ROSI|nr:hypothetical protein SLEP1_g31896 [Rubroshorea leprosula]